MEFADCILVDDEISTIEKKTIKHPHKKKEETHPLALNHFKISIHIASIEQETGNAVRFRSKQRFPPINP